MIREWSRKRNTMGIWVYEGEKMVLSYALVCFCELKWIDDMARSKWN